MLTKKKKLLEHETVVLSEKCNAILHYKLHPKVKDLENFTLPRFIEIILMLQLILE